MGSYGRRVFCHQNSPPHARQSALYDAPLVNLGSTVKIEPLNLMGNSPALAQLRAKLSAFEVLVERGDLDKAALIARDVQAVLEHFDPLTYLPSLFARYLKLLHATLDAIEPRWRADETYASRVLEQLYRADLDAFLDESS